jgi:hypothetical protein
MVYKKVVEAETHSKNKAEEFFAFSQKRGPDGATIPPQE